MPTVFAGFCSSTDPSFYGRKQVLCFGMALAHVLLACFVKLFAPPPLRCVFPCINKHTLTTY